MKKDFEILPHIADLKLRIFGSSHEELFKNALAGMFQAAGPAAPACRRNRGRLLCSELPIKRKISVESDDLDSLLVDFLSEALYLSDSKNEAYLDAKILRLTDKKVEAEIRGVKVNNFDDEIKAVTYHELEIKKVGDHFETVIVFDI